MEKNEFPFRFVIVVFVSLFLFSGLIWISFQPLGDFMRWLTTIGICTGAGWLIFLFGSVYAMIDAYRTRKNQEKEPERLKKHQSRFYCHICGKPSPKPYEYWEDYGEDGQPFYAFLVTDYEKPTELVQCARCQKWTCPDANPPHMENGVCKKCLENSPEQV